MASRRMFSKAVICTDAFMDLTFEAQALYFHLCMGSDDDGFNACVRGTMRMLSTDEDALEALASAGFVIRFPSGVVCIRHWRASNCIQKDRYKESYYSREKAMLTVSEHGIYNLIEEPEPVSEQEVSACEDDTEYVYNKEAIEKADADNACIQAVYIPYTQDRIDKIRLIKVSLGKTNTGEERLQNKTAVSFDTAGCCGSMQSMFYALNAGMSNSKFINSA